jgi:hypothetical protein
LECSRWSILLADLAKGKIGEEATMLVGSLLVTKLFLAALTRVDQPEQERKDFYLYLEMSVKTLPHLSWPPSSLRRASTGSTSP